MIDPIISIIIPTYNSAANIGSCLDSVLKQSFTNYEILIIDGLSVDDTIIIAQSYHDNRIRVVSEKDNGVYDAMNKGVKLSAGAWLYFLGSDDTLYAGDVLETIYGIISTNLYDVIYGNVFFVNRKIVYTGEVLPRHIFDTNISHQAIFFKKDAHIKVGEFDTYFKVYADWHHNIKWIFLKDIKVKFIDKIIANFSESGLSSGGDKAFNNLKSCFYLRYLSNEIPFSRKLKIFLSECKRALLERNFILAFTLIRTVPEIFFKM